MAEPQTLRRCFADAESRRKKLETHLSSTTSEFQTDLAAAISRYDECLEIADQVSLFSPNESLEDVSSADLQYFLIHYHIGDLVLRTIGDDRKSVLKRSRIAFERYLKLADSYDLLSREDFKTLERYSENPDAFSTAATTDPATRRQIKISRYKEEKALKGMLEQLQKDPMAVQNDESVLRELHLTQIHLCTHQTFQSLDSIAQELQILAMAPPSPPDRGPPPDSDSRKQGSSGKDEYSERLDPSLSTLLANTRGGPILSSSGRPLKPFTLLDSRQRLQQGVFRPDYNLPTMTIDEYLEEERRRGGIIEGGGPQSGVRPTVDEDDLQKADEETMKARRWDDFKEENPRGSGNTMNMG